MSTDQEKTQKSAEEQGNPEADAQHLYSFIAQQMQAGVDKSTISQKLEETGIDKDDAKKITETVTRQITVLVDKEQITPVSLGLASIGGVIAALVGGAIWGGLIIVTGYEIGYVAWGIGVLSGYAVALSAMGSRGVPIQVIALISSVFGILIGKYFVFFHYLKQSVEKEYGSEAVSQLSMFSEAVIKYFGENIISMLNVFDILWVVLAIGTAWYIPKGSGIQLPIEYRYKS